MRLLFCFILTGTEFYYYPATWLSTSALRFGKLKRLEVPTLMHKFRDKSSLLALHRSFQSYLKLSAVA